MKKFYFLELFHEINNIVCCSLKHLLLPHSSVARYSDDPISIQLLCLLSMWSIAYNINVNSLELNRTENLLSSDYQTGA